tara:strand:+ start:74 stop:721 length:648 start_codon:yes stop_codon:yes gene_type:complete
MNTIINIIRNFIGGVLVLFAIVGFLPIGNYIIALIIFLLGLLTIPSTNKATILLFKSPKSFIEELPIFSKKINSLLDNDYLYWVKPLFGIVFFAWCASVVFPDGIGCESTQDKVADAIAPLLNNPSSLQITELFGPYYGEFAVPSGGGKGFTKKLSSGCSEIESHTAKILGSNAFGGMVPATFVVFFKDGEVCGTYNTAGGTYLIDSHVERDCGC